MCEKTIRNKNNQNLLCHALGLWLAREPLTCGRNNLASNGKQKDETGGKQKHIKGSVKGAQEAN